MRAASFQRKRRLQPLTCVARHGWQRLEPSLTCQGGKGWSLRLRAKEAKAGAFAYVPRRQRLKPSLTCQGGKGWSLRLRAKEGKDWSLRLRAKEGKGWSLHLRAQGGKGWSLHLRAQ